MTQDRSGEGRSGQDRSGQGRSGRGRAARTPRYPARPRPPSMADVAAAAGVSAQTVSRVMRGTDNVDAATRDRVMHAVRTLGYRPNTAARALANGDFRMIGVVSFDLRAHGNARVLEAIVAAVQDTDFSVNVVVPREQTPDAVRAAFDRLTRQGVDGIIVNHAQVLADRLRLPVGLPLVVVDGADEFGCPIVRTDHAHGAGLVVGHLLALGHETVWHLAGPPDSYPARRRAEAWQHTVRAAGATAPPPVHGDWTAEGGYRAGLELADRPDVTAVFAANDQMALGLVRALHDRGRTVPGDVSVVGFDDIAEAAYFMPPLTTVRQDFAQVGATGVARLLAQLRGEPVAASVDTAPPELVVRASTARPRHHAR